MTSSADAVGTPPRTQSPATVRVFTQRFSSTARGARLARLLAVERLDAWGIPYGSGLSASAAQIVAELGANAVTHGRVPGRDFELRLTLTTAGPLRIEVSDTRGERLPQPATTSGDEVSGRGLLLVAALATTWGVEPRHPCGKTVWANLGLP